MASIRMLTTARRDLMSGRCRPRAGRLNLPPTRAVSARQEAHMIRLAFTLAVLSVPALVAADPVYKSGKNVSHDCAKDPSVTITGGDGSYKFTGACEKIAVTGGKNTLTIESVKEIAVTGGDNTIDVD